MPRLVKPFDQPQVQRDRLCKTRYGENVAGKWVRRSAFREVDYDPDDPSKLREFATFAEAFAFDEACRADGTGGRIAKYVAKPKSSVPEEQRAICTAIADMLKEERDRLRSRMSPDMLVDVWHCPMYDSHLRHGVATRHFALQEEPLGSRADLTHTDKASDGISIVSCSLFRSI
jgi:hypothetical protein